MKQLIILMVVTIVVFAQPMDSITFCTLDREVAGLMDALLIITTGQDDESTGVFTAGTAILRAEAALQAAILCDDSALPDEVLKPWTEYLKSSADCITHFRKVVGFPDSKTNKEVLLASFALWETTAEEFLESIQSTR